MVVKHKQVRSKNKLPLTFFILVGIAITSLALIKIFLLKQAQVLEVSQSYVVSSGTSTTGIGRPGLVPMSSSYPLPSPESTCVPRPACLDSNPPCKMAVQNMCETTTSPIPKSSPLPSGCSYQRVQCVQAPCPPQIVCTVTTSSPTPSIPTPTPDYSGKVASFQASKPCGSDNFLYISFTCQNGVTTVFASGSCNSILAALYSSQATCSNRAGVR